MSHASGGDARLLQAAPDTVRIVARKDDERPKEATIVFHVYKSTRGDETTVGAFADGSRSAEDRAAFVFAGVGVVVAEALLLCHAAARRLGVDAIRVDDPNGVLAPGA